MDQSKIVILGGSFSVLPARAGVIPLPRWQTRPPPRFTRTRGGDPAYHDQRDRSAGFYPHARG